MNDVQVCAVVAMDIIEQFSRAIVDVRFVQTAANYDGSNVEVARKEYVIVTSSQLIGK